jgi:hypothetical protein
MFGTRTIALIIALLLATHVIQPSDGWFIALAVLIGLSMLRSVITAPWHIVRWTAGRTYRDWGAGWRNRRWADEWWS